jgi:hypothetical protein
LRPGQRVFIPPLQILEKRYPALISSLPPGTAPAAAPIGTAPSAGEPLTQTGEHTYQVRDKPETFYEIARKLLGSGDRWADIARLNPQVGNPNLPLPVNTVVQLPAQ